MGTVAAEDKYSGAVDVVLVRSRVLPVLVLAGAGFTLVLLAFMPLALRACLLLATWVVCLGLEALRRVPRERVLCLGREGGVCVDGRAGIICNGSFVAAWLTVIRWRPAGARMDHTVLVLGDMLSPADFRKIRVLLRWG